MNSPPISEEVIFLAFAASSVVLDLVAVLVLDRNRIKQWLRILLIQFTGVIALRASGTSSSDGFFMGMVGISIGHLVVGATMFAWWDSRCLGDPGRRESAGIPQFGGRSRRSWDVLLLLSPWHVWRYREYMIEAGTWDEPTATP